MSLTRETNPLLTRLAEKIARCSYLRIEVGLDQVRLGIAYE